MPAAFPIVSCVGIPSNSQFYDSIIPSANNASPLGWQRSIFARSSNSNSLVHFALSPLTYIRQFAFQAIWSVMIPVVSYEIHQLCSRNSWAVATISIVTIVHCQQGEPNMAFAGHVLLYLRDRGQHWFLCSVTSEFESQLSFILCQHIQRNQSVTQQAVNGKDDTH